MKVISKTAAKPERAPDPRPARTRAAILAAVERLGEQGAELSVSSVVAEASLSRSSFYSQFNDIGDVAVQLLRELYEQNTVPSDPMAAVKFLLEEFSAHRHLYSAVLGDSATVSAEWEVCEIIAAASLPAIAAVAPSHIQPEFAARYFTSGALACIIPWLRSEQRASIDSFAEQLLELRPSWVQSGS